MSIVRAGWALGLAFCAVGVLAAWPAQKEPPSDKGKSDDSPIVAKTRKKLTSEVSIDAKDQPLKDLLAELSKQAEVVFYFDVAVPRHKGFTIVAKDKPLKEVLDEMFKDSGLGYVIHRKQNANDRYEGQIQIVQGNERGDPIAKGDGDKKEAGKSSASATKPAPKPPPKSEGGSGGDDAEKTAQNKLKLAKRLHQDGQIPEAREYLEEIVKKFPNSKAAEEAKELLKKWK